MRVALLVAWVSSVSTLASEPRDPFQPPPSETLRKAETCVRGSCRFGVRELTVVAVVKHGAERMAMLQDPEGVGYVVRPGSKIARERATVIRISGDRVELRVPDAAPEALTLSVATAPADPEPLDLSKPED